MLAILHALGMFIADLFKSRSRLEADLRRLTPVEVVWRSGDPPAHYSRCGAAMARSSGPLVGREGLVGVVGGQR
jgi:hypothetical protein